MDSLILDATCSKGRKWPAEADIRIDVRKEALPDIIADDRYLPFRAQVFSSIYCDPPHILYPGKNTWAKDGIMVKRFGFWKTRRDWYNYLEATNIEFARCLTSNGILYYKILDGLGGGTTKLIDLERMTIFEIRFDEVEMSKGINKRSKVHYLTMMPKGSLNQLSQERT